MSDPGPPIATDVQSVIDGLAAHDYLADEGLATAVFLALRLQRPLFLEGDAGVGELVERDRDEERRELEPDEVAKVLGSEEFLHPRRV